MSTQNNGSDITADSIKKRFEGIRDGSLHNLVENITELIRKYKKLQEKLKEQTEYIQKLNEQAEEKPNSFEVVRTVPPSSYKPDNAETGVGVSNVISIPEETIKQIKGELDEKTKEIERLKLIINRQKDLESERNATIEEMNKTAENIIGELNKVNGSIREAHSSSSGGKTNTKKNIKTKKRNKKTKLKRISLKRFKK